MRGMIAARKAAAKAPQAKVIAAPSEEDDATGKDKEVDSKEGDAAASDKAVAAKAGEDDARA